MGDQENREYEDSVATVVDCQDPLVVFCQGVMMIVLSKLDVRSLARTRLVSTNWLALASSDQLWAHKVQLNEQRDYISVTHRVKMNMGRERISIGYFVFPGEDVVIESTKYKPFKYADFQARNEIDLKAFGRKIRLSRFRKDEEPGSKEMI